MLHRSLERLWRYPHTVTISVLLDESRVAEAVDRVREAQGKLGLEQIAELHFFRLIVLPPDTDLRGRKLPSRLIVSAVYEGKLRELIARLRNQGGARLQNVLSLCQGFPRDPQPEAIQQWLIGLAKVPQALHVGTVWDELQFIKSEYQLQVAIADYVDSQHQSGAWSNARPIEIRRDIQTFVQTRTDLPQQARPRVAIGRWLARLLDLVLTVAIVAALPTGLACLAVWWKEMSLWHLLWLIPAIGVGLVALYLLVVRCFELVEGDLVVRPDIDYVRRLAADEDFGVQNQFTMLTPVRDSLFRRLNLRLVLWLANNVSKHWYTAGRLVGIDTIHFARFHVEDDGRRMLFMSDFDGGWERYLFDFLTVGSFAVVPIWTNLHGCPKTRFLRFPLPGFSQRFLPFTRANQRPTHLWYSAVDHLTVSEIKRNAEIRAGLFGECSESAAEKWLKLI